MYDWLVVGAGFAGSVIAERLATQRDEKVLLIDRRSHVGGNAYDRLDKAGVMIHQYGPHIFHTNSDAILSYLSQFTAWRPYEHRVLAEVDGKRVPVPINLTTINTLYDLNLTPTDLDEWFAARAEPVAEIKTSEDVVVSAVGRELYEKFFLGYTTKQWGVTPAELDKSVTSRVPTRTSAEDRYFLDKHQCMPLHGYTQMFNKMVTHPNIDVMLDTDYRDIRGITPYKRMIFTGPIDEYFEHRYGKLPCRSLNFKHVTLNTEWHQPVAVINYPQEHDYTRVTEYKYLTGQTHAQTSITYEYPTDEGDPYYPVPRAENQELYKKYERLAAKTANVWFVGRLGTYRYYNMDQVVGQSLATFRRLNEELGAPVSRAPAARIIVPRAEEVIGDVGRDGL